MLLLGAAFLTGCSDDESYDVNGSLTNLVYLKASQNGDFNCDVLRTPAGVFGRVAADLTVNMQYATSSNVQLTAAVNGDLATVAQYNAAHGTDYALPSADILAAMTPTVTAIEAGKNVTETPVTLSLPADKLPALTEPTYIIPVQLVLKDIEGSTGTRPVQVSEELNRAYIIVHTSDADDFSSVTGATEISSNIVKTPVGNFGGISATVQFSNLCAVTGDMEGSLVVDNSLIAAYNAEKGTNYSPLPAEALEALTVTPGVVKEGETATTEGIRVSVPDAISHQLEGSFLIPMRLQTSFANGAKHEENDIVYIKVEVKTSLINENPSTILGTIQTNGNDVWTCLSAENFNADEMTTSGWTPSASRVSSAQVVIDLGTEHKVSAFMVDMYVMRGVKLYLSTDNVNWTDCGDTEGKNKVYDNNWNSWYVFYGGVPARYVKFDFTLNSSHWAWSYPQWGYCDLSFNFAFDD